MTIAEIQAQEVEVCGRIGQFVRRLGAHRATGRVRRTLSAASRTFAVEPIADRTAR
jgi:hypothetical protein